MQLADLIVTGPAAVSTWLWTLNPSLAYVGQGISLAHASLRPILLSPSSPLYAAAASRLSALTRRGRTGYVTVATTDSSVPPCPSSEPGHDPPSPTASIAVSETWDAADDAPPEQQVGNRVVAIGLVLSVLICIAAVHAVFGRLVPLYATIIAVAIAMVLSVMGVRALGEVGMPYPVHSWYLVTDASQTDLNPVSGISKLAQLFFAVIIPQSNRASVLINLVAGAVVRLLANPLPARNPYTSIFPFPPSVLPSNAKRIYRKSEAVSRCAANGPHR